MFPNDELARSLHRQRADAARQRARARRRNPRPNRHSVRRAVGRSIISIGQRIAAEAPHQPARST